MSQMPITLEQAEQLLKELSGEIYNLARSNSVINWRRMDELTMVQTALDEWKRNNLEGAPVPALASWLKEQGVKIAEVQSSEAPSNSPSNQYNAGRDQFVGNRDVYTGPVINTSYTVTSAQISEDKEKERLAMLLSALNPPSSRLSQLEVDIVAARNYNLSLPVPNNQMSRSIEAAMRHREELLGRMGIASTLINTNRLAEAINELEELLSDNIFEYLHGDGSIVPTAQALRDVRQEYAEYCRFKAEEKIARAEKLMPDKPAAALYEIESALKMLTALSPHIREELERLQWRYAEQTKAYNAAMEKRRIALGFASLEPDKVYSMLMEAISIYPELPGIEIDLHNALNALGTKIGTEVENMLYRVERLIRYGQDPSDREDAHTYLKAAIKMMREVPRHYPAIPDLRKRIQQVEARLAEWDKEANP